MGKSRRPTRSSFLSSTLFKDEKSRSERNVLCSSSDDERLSSTSTSTAWSGPPLVCVETERANYRNVKLDKCLDALYEKRGLTREKSLTAFVEAFERHVFVNYVENKTITLLHLFINSIKRGSSKEICLASRAIGLLAITSGSGSNAHEIMEESIPCLSQALQSGPELLKPSVLGCLTIISLVGANTVEETERMMQIIWEVICPTSCSNVSIRQTTATTLAAAISAWTFLLTTLNEWRISSTNWQESVPYLSSLLDKDDSLVCIAAGEALALIFEIDRLYKFCREVKGSIDTLDHDGETQSEISYIEAVKHKILNQAKNIVIQSGGRGSSKADLNRQTELFQCIAAYIETREFDEVSTKAFAKHDPLKITTWAQLIQVKFVRQFLGSGYAKHMKDNELLHDVFDFMPKTREKMPGMEKKPLISTASMENKERTQYLNKSRILAQNKKQGHFAVGVEDD